MTSFKDEFERIVSTLEAHPKVEVFGAELGEPATKKHVCKYILAAGIEPTDAMLAFYTQHNGAYLEWGIKGNKDYAIIGELNGYVEYGTPPGVINIIPVEEAFSSQWQDDYIINQIIGEAWELAYGTTEPTDRTTAVLIDHFSFYRHSDLILGPEPLLVIASDHGADLSCSDYVTFAQYLELVIARYGSSPHHAIGIGWTREAERVKTIAKPTLDEIIAKVIEDANE